MQHTLRNKLISLFILGFLVWGVSTVSGKSKKSDAEMPVDQTTTDAVANENNISTDTTSTQIPVVAPTPKIPIQDLKPSTADGQDESGDSGENGDNGDD